MKKLITICLLTLFWACSDKALDLSGETTIKPSDYVKAFAPIKGNYLATDADFIKKADTIEIGLKALQQFMPDSAVQEMVKMKKKKPFIQWGSLKKKPKNIFYSLLKIKKRLSFLCTLPTKN